MTISLPGDGSRWRLGAVRGLSLTVMNHRPALSRLDGERLGIAVAGLGHPIHGAR